MRKRVNMGKTLDELLDALNTLWTSFNNCRAHFPYIPDTAVGIKSAKTAPFYVKQGFNVSFVFSDGLSKEEISKINHIGHWINQNFIIRLYALLESFHVISDNVNINPALDGSEHVDIVRRLRNYFAHSSGRFNSSDEKHKMTMEVIGEKFGISVENSTEWPLSINTVLKPLYKGCVTYSKQKMKSA
jgi:hypothetical protein